MYYAHGGNWLELVTKNNSGVTGKVIVGSGVTIDQNNIDAGHVTGIVTAKSYVGGGDGKFVTAEWAVTANGSSNYVFNGPGGLSNASNSTLYLARGQTYQFNVNASGHGFGIQTVSGTWTGSNAYTTGITNAAAAVGVIKFEVPFSAPNTLYYACTTQHSGMVGSLVIYPSI